MFQTNVTVINVTVSCLSVNMVTILNYFYQHSAFSSSLTQTVHVGLKCFGLEELMNWLQCLTVNDLTHIWYLEIPKYEYGNIQSYIFSLTHSVIKW